MSLLVAVLALLVAACSAEEPPPGTQAPAQDPSKPYVISAIDYHFHDAHPTEELEPDREVVVSNQGRNVHNVTIGGYSVDVRPGERVSLGTAGERFGSGSRAFICRYHADRGMSGTVLVEG